MTDRTRSHRPLASLLLLLLTCALATAACGAAAAPTSSPIPSPTPTPVPGAGGNIGGGAVGGGGAGGNTGSGIVPPVGGGLPGGDPTLGQAQLVTPQPGQHDLHPVAVSLARAAVDGHHVTVELRWWSGVAPCTILDSVKVERDGTTITITPFEGSSGQNVACEDIAQLKATIVDLGDLPSGAYTVKANAAPEITVSVS